MSKIPCVLLMNDMHASKDTLSAFELNWMEALQICGEKGIEEIVVGGDLWQSRSSQTLSTLLLVQKCLLEATNRGILVTLAEGNHDLVDQESFEGYNHIFSPYKNVDVVDDHTVIEFDKFHLTVMSYFPENGSFIDRLNTVKQSLNPKQHNILYIHQGINGALKHSSDHELPTHIFKEFDAVLVGHYHDRIKIPGTNIEYIGSSRQHNFGEDEEKGYTIIFDDGSYEFIQNKVNTRYKTIDLQFKEINNQLLEEYANLSGYRVKARIHCIASESSKIDKAKLLQSGIAKVETVIEEKSLIKTKSSSLHSKFNKQGIKDEYVKFCQSKKDSIDPKIGLKYLDKIKEVCGH